MAQPEDAVPSAPSENPQRRRRRRAMGSMLLAILWGGAATYLAFGAAASLDRAETSLAVAQDAVVDADIDTAVTVMNAAHSELSSADAALGNPLVVPFRFLPFVGADLRAATAIANGGAELGDASIEALTVLDALPDGAHLAPVDGAFPVGTIERLSGPVRRMADAAADALLAVEAAPASGHIDRIVDGRERVLGLLTPLATRSETAAQLTAQLPDFLGASGPRTYLFGASTPAELRGTGGFIGSVSVLTIEAGRLEFGAFEPANDFPVLAPDALPAPVASDAERWSRYDGTGNWLTLNRTPHFPAAAHVMMQHWEATQGVAVDGFIVADPFALEALLAFAGPADVPAYDVRLDAGSVVAFMTNEAYSVFDDEDERKAVLGAVSAATLERFLTTDSDTGSPTELLTSLGRLAAGGHVLAYAQDDETQRAFSRAGLTGELRDPEGELVNVVVNSGSVSKIDYYADRRIEHEVTLLQDGAAHSRLAVTLGNDAPTSGQPAYVIGPDRPSLPAGSSLVDVSVYLAQDAVFSEVPRPMDGMPSFTETELGHPVHDGWVRIPSGGQVERRYEWTTPDVWSVDPEGNLEYQVLFQGQTVVRETDLVLRVNLPSGFEVIDLPEGARIEDEAIVQSAPVRGEDVTLRIGLRPLSEP